MIASIAIGLLVGAYGLILCLAAGKREPKPGKDYDERGPYDDAVNKIQENVHFDVKKFLKKGSRK